MSEFGLQGIDESTKNLSSAAATNTGLSVKQSDEMAGKRSVRATRGYNSKYDRATYLGIGSSLQFTGNPS